MNTSASSLPQTKFQNTEDALHNVWGVFQNYLTHLKMDRPYNAMEHHMAPKGVKKSYKK